MRQSIIYASENKNCYLYNDKHRFSMIIHPALKQICETEKCNYVDSYYVKKYMYLKKHDFFSLIMSGCIKYKTMLPTLIFIAKPESLHFTYRICYCQT